MSTRPQLLLTGAQARAADEAAVAAGETWDGLMARAGHGLAAGVLEELRGRTGGAYGRDVLLVAGRGDNGGDAWVAARHLADAGVRATVLAVHGVDVDTSEHSAAARSAWLRAGGRVVDGVGDRDRTDAALARADLRVDAVLGTGIHGAPRDEAQVGVELCNEGGGPVVAADVPSGVDADTGAVPGGAVRAVRTVTFGGWKRGLALHPGAGLAGRVDVVGLGSRWDAVLEPPDWSTTGDADAWLPALAVGDDKHARGRVLVVAGSRRYAGAAALCAAAAVRAGAGLVTLATTAPREPVLVLEPGVMVIRLPALDPEHDGGAGGPSPDAVGQVARLVQDVDAVVLGPGCGHGPGTRALADALLATGLPVVLDADGLNVFRGDADALAEHRGPLVLTPHHRELGRLVDVDGDEALARRHELVPALAARLDAVVVGKGPGTVVAAPGSDRVRVVTAGGPALGSGGTGDVLAGLLAAALAAGPHDDVASAVVGAVHRHALAGQRAGARAGGRASARDLLEVLPGLLAELTRGQT